jgi:DNA-binding protein H-NS
MFVNIPSAKLKQLVKLSQQKEALLAQIQEIDRDMIRLEREFQQKAGSGMRKGRLTFSTSRKRTPRRAEPRVRKKNAPVRARKV